MFVIRVVKMRILILIASVAMIGTPVFAQSQMTQEDFKSACMGDYRKFCFGVLPGGGRIIACLGKHADELAPACAKAVAVGTRCVEDYKKFCPDVSPDGGQLRICLTQHKTQLSPDCATVIAKAAAR